MKCKANLFYSKLIDSLNSNESTTKDFTTEYDIYYKFFNEIASFLKPFDRVLKCVFNGMQKYWCEKTEIGKNIQERKNIEDENSRLTKEIAKLNNDKNTLIKKLNKISEELSKANTQINTLSYKLKKTELNFEKINNSCAKTDQLAENVLKKTQIINQLNSEIEIYKIQNIKDKRIIDLARSQFKELDYIIKNVNQEFGIVGYN